jgi:heptaprenyl diphosphate synthase
MFLSNWKPHRKTGSMASLNNAGNDRIATKTVWLLCAVALNALEFFIPRIPFFPWLKPGFANIITIIWIIEFGAVDAVLYALLRVWIVGFFFGFSFLTMSLALCGGILSTVAMSLLWAGLGRNRVLGTLGLGICGALFHNLGQIMAVYGLMAANMHLFYQVPAMFVASVIFGGIVGILAPPCRNALIASGQARPAGTVHASLAFSATRSDYVFSLLLLGGCCAIVFVDSPGALCASACGATLIVQVQRKGNLSAFFAPLTSFWILFVFIACVNIFFSYGTALERFPFLTREGVDLTVRQWLRLWTWLEVSFLLSYFKFHAVMFSVLRKLFPRHQSTLFAGVLGLEYFPAIASDGRMLARKTLGAFFSHPLRRLQALAAELRKSGLPGLVQRWTDALYGTVLKRLERG